MTTTILIQLGHTAAKTIKLHDAECQRPHINMSVHAFTAEHAGRKFAYRTPDTHEWDHGTRNSLYEYIAANAGQTVYVRLYTDVTKYAR